MPAEGSAVTLRSDTVSRGPTVTISVNGRELEAYEGESVLAVLWAEQVHTLHRTARRHEPRGCLCCIGICFDCLVTVNGKSNVRACLEVVQPGMRIETQDDAGRHSTGAQNASD